MKVGQDKVVTIRYTLQVEGEVLDQGELSYLHGHRNLIPGLEEALEAFRGLSGRVGLWVERDGRPVLALEEDTPLAVASAFKLLVLAALREEVEAGRRAWDEVVRLEEAWKSLPSGLLQGWPEGSPLTLHTLAALMISLSDNTATDALIALLGRERLEALSPRNRPFLTTREAFGLAARGNRDLLAAFRDGDLEAKRRTLEVRDRKSVV